MNGTPSSTAAPLALFEALCAFDSPTAGQWIDCATRLEIAASESVLAGQPGQAGKLRGRADECRSRARSAARRDVSQLTAELPIDWAPRIERSSLPVHMPVARDLAAARAVTQQMPCFGGDEVRS